MTPQELAALFRSIQEEMQGIEAKAERMFYRKDEIAQKMERLAAPKYEMSEQLKTRLIHLIEEEELPWWMGIEECMKEFRKELKKRSLLEIAPNSSRISNETMNSVEELEGITYQIKQNLIEQIRALKDIQWGGHDTHLKVFKQKFLGERKLGFSTGEQKKLFDEMGRVKARIGDEIVRLSQEFTQELVKNRRAEQKPQESAQGWMTVGKMILYLGFLCATGYAYDTANMKKTAMSTEILARQTPAGLSIPSSMADNALMWRGKILKASEVLR